MDPVSPVSPLNKDTHPLPCLDAYTVGEYNADDMAECRFGESKCNLICVKIEDIDLERIKDNVEVCDKRVQDFDEAMGESSITAASAGHRPASGSIGSELLRYRSRS